MATLSLTNITKSFGAVQVIRDINLEINDGEFVVFIGPSGCGKSTLLRIISGLEEVDGGDIILNGEWVNQHTPFERKVAMVFQSYALYPHMSVAQNMGFPLKMVNASPETIKREIHKAAEVLQLTDLLDRKPDQLSGGQKQRVAMGRTIVRDPQLFLFDEPLSNLDADLRIEMRVEIEKLHKRLDATMIYVTHDQVEAMTLADRIVVLRDGKIEQVGSPLDLYENPTNTFVASFLGSPKISFLPVKFISSNKNSSTLALDDTLEFSIPLPAPNAKPGDEMQVGIRPEDVSLHGGNFELPFDLELHERLGPTSYLYGTCVGHTLIGEHKLRGAITSTEAKSLSINSAHVHLFDAQGQSVKNSSGVKNAS